MEQLGKKNNKLPKKDIRETVPFLKNKRNKILRNKLKQEGERLVYRKLQNTDEIN